jgi:hypothetical protein
MQEVKTFFFTRQALIVKEQDLIHQKRGPLIYPQRHSSAKLHRPFFPNNPISI